MLDDHSHFTHVDNREVEAEESVCQFELRSEISVPHVDVLGRVLLRAQILVRLERLPRRAAQLDADCARQILQFAAGFSHIQRKRCVPAQGERGTAARDDAALCAPTAAVQYRQIAQSSLAPRGLARNPAS